MEIIVKGKGKETIKPNEIITTIQFIAKRNTYHEALELGLKSVDNFINELLIPIGFNKEDLKTKSFIIREETKYNETTRNYDNDGYSYNQTATLKYEYSIIKATNFIEKLSTLENPPLCDFTFSISNSDEIRNIVLAKAYKDAESKASAIANAANSNLVSCEKIDFEPFTDKYLSNSNLDIQPMMFQKTMNSNPNIETILTPEDIEIEETLYCKWEAK